MPEGQGQDGPVPAEPEAPPPGANQNNVPPQAPPQPQAAANQQRAPPGNPLIMVRDRLFHALFYRIALTYARAFPPSVRRFIEFTILLKVCFLLLMMYIYL